MEQFKYFIARKSDQPLWLFAGLWLLTVLFYVQAYRGGFYEDFLGFLYHFRTQSYTTFVSPPGHKMYLGVNTVQYFFIYLFGRQPLPWFLLFTGLHAATALMLLRFFKSLFLFWEGKYNQWMAITGILFWLLTPLAVETVNWKACSHYMCSMIMMFAILNWFVRYLEAPKVLTVLKILFVFSLSVFFLELFFLTPVFLVILLVSAAYCDELKPGIFTKAFLQILIPVLILFGLYFLLSGHLNGQSYERYPVKPGTISNPLFIASKVSRYIIHIYFMEYFLPANLKYAIYRFLDKPLVSRISAVTIALLMLLHFFRMRKAVPSRRLISLLFLLFMASFIIILPMWFYEEFPYQGSRYYYLPGAFGYMLLAAVIFRLPVALKIRTAMAGVYLCCCMAGTLYLVKNVRDGERILARLLDSFSPWAQKEEVFLLDLPIYYRGIGLIGATAQSNFAYHLDVLRNKKTKARIYDVSSFNMTEKWAGVHIQVVGPMELKVNFNQDGNWWWYTFQGAADYENDRYKVTFTNNGSSYLIRFKQPLTSSSGILFQSGGTWKEVDMSKKGEQW